MATHRLLNHLVDENRKLRGEESFTVCVRFRFAIPVLKSDDTIFQREFSFREKLIYSLAVTRGQPRARIELN